MCLMNCYTVMDENMWGLGGSESILHVAGKTNIWGLCWPAFMMVPKDTQSLLVFSNNETELNCVTKRSCENDRWQSRIGHPRHWSSELPTLGKSRHYIMRRGSHSPVKKPMWRNWRLHVSSQHQFAIHGCDPIWMCVPQPQASCHVTIASAETWAQPHERSWARITQPRWFQTPDPQELW